MNITDVFYSLYPARVALSAALGGLLTGTCCAATEPFTPPVEVTTEHSDFLILYQPEAANPLSLVLRDEERGINYSTNEVVLVVGESARITLPAGTPFGEEGEPIWVLPQSQDPSLLYLGFSAERIPLGIFTRPFNVRLMSVEGPGHFFAWQAGGFGGLNVKMNSRDGVTEADRTTPIVGSHEHFNWGFTTNGIHRVTFQVDGQRAGESTNLVSLPATFVFHVLPLPEVPPEPPRLSAPALNERGRFQFTLHGTPGHRYTIETSAGLSAWSEAKLVVLEHSSAMVELEPRAEPVLFVRAAIR